MEQVIAMTVLDLILRGHEVVDLNIKHKLQGRGYGNGFGLGYRAGYGTGYGSGYASGAGQGSRKCNEGRGLAYGSTHRDPPPGHGP